MANETTIPKNFEFKEAEPRIYALWEKKNIFKGVVDKSKKPFCVVMPPPNVTGRLHMGHVLDNLAQDVMVRWHRMKGYAALWIPGTDHAGIATQNVVKRELGKQKIKIADLGREKFLEKVWAWKEEYGNIIVDQLKRLGCSCDWSRERFTMDEGLSQAVLKAFIHLHKKGLIYKGKRMINWCTVCGTALSDDEVSLEDRNSSLWHFKYPILGDDNNPTGEFIVVATTRPETMLGDTAIAVHPKDARYKKLKGKSVLLPLQNRKIPIIFDEYVDKDFGSGAVKVTPAHDPNDHKMGVTHKLRFEEVIGKNGKMTAAAGAYAGLDSAEARKKVVADLEAAGFVEKIEKYSHAVGECYRCKTAVEPLISDQWFVKVRPLAEAGKQAVVDGRISVVPDSEKHDYFHWMDTIEDWCISRQLWWGHRIPVYYCDECHHPMAALSAPASCEKCACTKFSQDEDVLDTWFSSQLWPFATLGWPDATEEMKFWFPTSWLMSGRDILFFWDTRMIMSSLELTGDVPFRTLALHGLVRDEQGRKLSKSLGNSRDPLELFDLHGADGVRAAVALRYPMGRQDTTPSGDFYKLGQATVTKLWNASRLLLSNLDADAISRLNATGEPKHIEDRWILSRLGKTIASHDEYLNKSDFSHAFQALNDFFWSDFCDWYLEIIKPRMRAEGAEKAEALVVALRCAQALCKLFHPYIPFVTEEIWQQYRTAGVLTADDAGFECCALAQWPAPGEFLTDTRAERKLEITMSLVRGVRDIRHLLVLAPKVPLQARVQISDEGERSEFSSYETIVKNIGFFDNLTIMTGDGVPEGFVPVRFDGGMAYVKLPADSDVTAIKAGLENKIRKLEKDLEVVQKKLSTPSFADNAPPAVVDEVKGRCAEMVSSIDKLREFQRIL